ncbi:unnamed protein product [Schistocephalus solidus]|uniref:N-acetyltransferase domain-containing protein n=1 Tax=Schistocephalus solidus TaxID=70667 RepID=A0A183SJ93_SCHSO|nr:unnamed protein product [Schistocephalus solidus]
MGAFIAKYDIGIGAFLVDALCEATITEYLDTHVEEMKDTSCCLFMSKLNRWGNTTQALMQLLHFGGLYDKKCIIYVSDPHFWSVSSHNLLL